MNALNAEVQAALSAAAIEAGQRRDVAASSSTAARRSSPPARTSRRWSGCPTRTWPTTPAPSRTSPARLARIPKPTVAAITGYALGGGCEVALACDFRVAAKNAKLGQPEILLGIIPGAGGTQRLARLVGPAKAKDIVFSGRFVSADEALAIGLVDEVVEAEDVYAAAKARLAPYVGGPAYAIRAAKEAIDRGLETDLETGLEIERMLFSCAVRHQGPRDRDEVVRRERPRQGEVRGRLSHGIHRQGARPRHRPPTAATAEQVAAAYADNKLAQVLYHDWEAADLRREVVDLLRRALHRLRPRPVRRHHRHARPAALRARRSSWAPAPASSRSTSSRPASSTRCTSPTCRPGWSRPPRRNAETLGFTVAGQGRRRRANSL